MEREYWWDTVFSSLGMLSLQINLGVCEQGNLLAVINHETSFKRERWRHQVMVAVSTFDLNIFQQYLSCAQLCLQAQLNALYMLTPLASLLVTALTFLDHFQSLIWGDNRKLMLLSGGFESEVLLCLCHRGMDSF